MASGTIALSSARSSLGMVHRTIPFAYGEPLLNHTSFQGQAFLS